jgi:hypothetical protein
MISRADPNEGATMGESTPRVDRLVQGLNYRLQDHQVGVMNVFDKDGSPTAQLSVFDPASSSGESVRVRRDDEFAVGAHTYRVIDVVLERSGRRDFVDVVPIRLGRWRRIRRRFSRGSRSPFGS